MAIVTNRGKALLMNGGLDLDTQDIRVLLCTASFTPSVDHNFVSEVTNECTGTGYARTALTSESVTEDDTNDRAVFDAADVTWTGANFGTPAYAVIYRFVTNDADSPIIAVHTITSPVATNGGDYTLVWSANGLIRAA
jgi:hypothetical protein